MKPRLLVLLLIAAVVTSSAHAQGSGGVSKRGTTAAPFLSIPQGARALGMGGAFVATATDPSAMYWNPAGIAKLDGIHIVFDHTYWIADLTYDYLGATVSLGSYGTLGLNVTASNVGDMKVTTVEQQEGTGEVFDVTDVAVGVSYALSLTEDFSIGFNPKFIYQSIWKMSASAIALDLGILYRTPFEGFTLGMSVSNFGSSMKMTGNSALVLYDPDAENSGNNGSIPAELATDEWALPLNFRVGVAYDFPIGDIVGVTLEVDAQHPNDDHESVNLGGEFVYDDMVFLRGGWKSLWQQESEEGLTLGIGVRKFIVGNFQIALDYAYQDFSRLKNAQKITLGVGF